MERGEIWWASLPKPRGSGPGFRRPVLIVQSDSFNSSRISTVVATVLTSNIKLAEAPGNIMLRARQSGLPKASVVNVSQIITVDKTFLTKKVRKLGKALMSQIESGVRLVLDL